MVKNDEEERIRLPGNNLPARIFLMNPQSGTGSGTDGGSGEGRNKKTFPVPDSGTGKAEENS